MGERSTVDLWNLLNRKWSILIIKQFISDRPRRFRDLLKKLNGISSRTLAGRLREFEKAGLLSRKMYSEIPPKVEYTLTKKGKELRSIIGRIEQLTIKWRKDHLESFRK